MIMKEIKYTCDKCKKPIDKTYLTHMAGGNELCVLSYDGRMGHVKFPLNGFHFHYECFTLFMSKVMEYLN